MTVYISAVSKQREESGRDGESSGRVMSDLSHGACQ
jgi:hypothetical protein